MYLPRSDVFKDLRQEAVSDISDIAVAETHQKGTRLFSAGDSAAYFYILVEGAIGLSIVDGGSSHYTISNIGESFGWSSVVGRDAYSATAECLEPSKVLKIDRTSLEKVFDSHARSGRVFYKRLAAALGSRWLDLHRQLMSEMGRTQAVSHGTGQVSDTRDD